jgi:hypothetical protein
LKEGKREEVFKPLEVRGSVKGRETKKLHQRAAIRLLLLARGRSSDTTARPDRLA